jgi:hypothetical protein
LPRVDWIPPGSVDLYLLQRTAYDYLPGALDAYLRLPPGYVSERPGSEGKTALSVLLEELDVLEAGMRTLAADVHQADMDRLLSHKRFLLERFGHDQGS